MAVENVLVQHIEKTPGVVGGKARIAGTRITVNNVAIWHERMGMRADEIASEFDLTLSDIYAALAYYYDHRVEIDDEIRDDVEFVQELKKRTPSFGKSGAICLMRAQYDSR